MFEVKDDLTIYATRGDIVYLTVSALDNGNNYIFRQGDVLRMKIFEKKDCQCVVMQQDFSISEDTKYVDITLESKHTRIGEVISKPKTYWYEIELNPETAPQTIIGYTPETGARQFVLLPEGKELGEYPQADIPMAYEVEKQLERAEAAVEKVEYFAANPPKPIDVIGAVLEPITDNPGARVVTSDGYLITVENGNSITTMDV